MDKKPLLSEITTTLGKRTSFSGTLSFNQSLKIDGRFKGKIVSEGFLYIERGAVVEAEISVGALVIGGTIIGDIKAEGAVEFLETGRLKGNVAAPEIRITDGVELDGKCEMIRNPEQVDIFSASVDQLKKSVQRVAAK